MRVTGALEMARLGLQRARDLSGEFHGYGIEPGEP
jgi:hypothetical protein